MNIYGKVKRVAFLRADSCMLVFRNHQREQQAPRRSYCRCLPVAGSPAHSRRTRPYRRRSGSRTQTVRRSMVDGDGYSPTLKDKNTKEIISDISQRGRPVLLGNILPLKGQLNFTSVHVYTAGVLAVESRVILT